MTFVDCIKAIREALEQVLEYHDWESDPEAYRREHDGWEPNLPWRRVHAALAVLEDVACELRITNDCNALLRTQVERITSDRDHLRDALESISEDLHPDVRQHASDAIQLSLKRSAGSNLYKTTDEQKARLCTIATKMSQAELANDFINEAVDLAGVSEGVHDLFVLWEQSDDPEERRQIIADIKEALHERKAPPSEGVKD